MASVAPNRRDTGRMKITPTTESATPSSSVTSTIMEKYRLASFFSPSPSTLATRAVPPVPIMKPMPPSTMIKGITRLMAAKAVFPA